MPRPKATWYRPQDDPPCGFKCHVPLRYSRFTQLDSHTKSPSMARHTAAAVAVAAGAAALAVAYALHRRRQARAAALAALTIPLVELRKGTAVAKKVAALFLETLHPERRPGAEQFKELFYSISRNGCCDAAAFGDAVLLERERWEAVFPGASARSLIKAFSAVTKGAGGDHGFTWEEGLAAAKAYAAMHVLASMLMRPKGLRDLEQLFARLDLDRARHHARTLEAPTRAARLPLRQRTLTSTRGSLPSTDNELVDTQELTRGLQNDPELHLQLGGLSPAEGAMLFERLARDGSLSFVGFISSLSTFSVAQRFADAMATDAGKAALRALLTTLDKDGNGRISRVRCNGCTEVTAWCDG